MSLSDDRKSAYVRMRDNPTSDNHAKYVALNLACYLAGEIDSHAYKSNCAEAARRAPRKAKQVNP